MGVDVERIMQPIPILMGSQLVYAYMNWMNRTFETAEGRITVPQGQWVLFAPGGVFIGTLTDEGMNAFRQWRSNTASSEPAPAAATASASDSRQSTCATCGRTILQDDSQTWVDLRPHHRRCAQESYHAAGLVV